MNKVCVCLFIELQELTFSQLGEAVGLFSLFVLAKVTLVVGACGVLRFGQSILLCKATSCLPHHGAFSHVLHSCAQFLVFLHAFHILTVR